MKIRCDFKILCYVQYKMGDRKEGIQTGKVYGYMSDIIKMAAQFRKPLIHPALPAMSSNVEQPVNLCSLLRTQT